MRCGVFWRTPVRCLTRPDALLLWTTMLPPLFQARLCSRPSSKYGTAPAFAPMRRNAHTSDTTNDIAHDLLPAMHVTKLVAPRTYARDSKARRVRREENRQGDNLYSLKKKAANCGVRLRGARPTRLKNALLILCCESANNSTLQIYFYQMSV